MKYGRIFGLLLCSFLIIICCSCKTGSGLLGNIDSDKTKIVTSDVISLPMERIRTLNPVVSKDEDSYFINKLIYQGLFELNENLEPRPVLAREYSYDEDGSSITIKLKRKVLWQDGTPFTASDVKFSIEAYLSVLNTGKSLYDSYVENIKGVKIIDDNTLKITYAKAKNVAIENLVFPIIPAATEKRPKDVQNITKDFFPIGTGPYMVESMKGTIEIQLKGNPNYRGNIPSNTIVIKFVPGKIEAVSLFGIHEIDMSFLKDTDRETMINNNDVKIISFPSNEIEILGFNFKHEALSDKKVRSAISYGIDRGRILETCYLNSGILNPSIYYPGYLGVSPEASSLSHDTEKGRQLLEEAGYSSLSLSLLVNEEDKARKHAASMVRSELGKMGISVTLNAVDWDQYNKSLATGNYDIFMGGYRIKEIYDMRPLLHSAYSNPIGYDNPILDILLDQMQSPIDINEKRQVYGAIEKVLGEEIPYFCILHKTYGLIISDHVEGTPNPQFNDIYRGCENLSLHYEIEEKD